MYTNDEFNRRLSEWADWRDALTTTGIGYPSQTQEAKAQGGGGSRVSKSIVPHVDIPGHLLRIDRAIRLLDTRHTPEEKFLRRVLHVRYEVTPADVGRKVTLTPAARAELLGMRPAAMYQKLAEAYAWLRGAMAACA